MMTASKAKMSTCGPSVGRERASHAEKTPARATVPSAIAVATAYTCRSSSPISAAVSGSSLVARIARPTRVRAEQELQAVTSTPTATTSVISGSQPTDSGSVSRRLAVPKRAAVRLRVSARERLLEQRSAARPTARTCTSSGASSPARRLPGQQRALQQRSPARRSPGPPRPARRAGAARVAPVTTRARNAASTVRSPCARLTMRMHAEHQRQSAGEQGVRPARAAPPARPR